MPQSAKIEVQIDKSSDVLELRSSRDEDEFAKSSSEFGSAANNGSDFSSILEEEESDFNYSEALNENFHSGHKRDALHR
jgi:hypothetical protein